MVELEGQVLRGLEGRGLLTPKDYAQHAGVSDMTAYRRFAGEGQQGITVQEVNQVLRSIAPEIVKCELSDLVHHETRHITTFLDDIDPAAPACVLANVAKSLHTLAQLMEQTVAAHADGVVTEEEAEQLKVQIKGAIRSLNKAFCTLAEARPRRKALPAPRLTPPAA